uniref:dTDP-D-glucose 4,6-dehydratase n=1 Tax=Plectus sambesii TaxID=2011161 RepID=A0A914XDX2_9BILA
MTMRTPKSVLVTGGCGFIGSNFINQIYIRWPDAKIVNLDKLLPGSNACNVDCDLRNNAERYRLVVGDCCNRELTMKLLQDHQIDTIVHFAANSSVDDCYRDSVGAARNNVLAMTHFLEVCRLYDRLELFMHISTDEVYGDSGKDSQPKMEQSLLTPTNPYAATKASCEAMLNAYRVSYKLPTITARMNNVYGPRQCNAKVVPRFVLQAFEGQPFTVMSDGEQLRSWMYVDDCCEGLAKLAEQGRIGEIYNMGAKFELSILDLAKQIHEETKRQSPDTVADFSTVPMCDRPYIDRRYHIDTQKMEKEIGWTCTTSFEQGLQRTVAWYMRPPMDRQTEKILIYGGKGWIGSQFAKLCDDRAVAYVLGATRPGDDRDEVVEQEIVRVAPSHVVSFLGRTHGPGCNTIEYLEGGPDKLKENAQDNLYAPWLLATLCRKLGVHMTYVGTGCLFSYDKDHPIGGRGYTEDDEPNYFGNSYSVVKGYTDRVMHHFDDSVLNARIRLPVNFELDTRNLVAKVISYKQIFDMPNSITILPDILPILLDLMKKRYTGTLNMTNPGAVKHSETLAAYNRLVDAEKTWQVIGDDDPRAESMRSARANCALDTTKLQQLYPDLRSARDGVLEAIKHIAAQRAAQ